MRRRDGKTYFVMVDTDAFRDGVGRLLAEVQRIKSEGDYAAAQALFETYGVHFDPALRDEVVARVDALKLPSYTGFVMPRLDAGARTPTARSSTSRSPIRATSRRRCSSIPRCRAAARMAAAARGDVDVLEPPAAGRSSSTR